MIARTVPISRSPTTFYGWYVVAAGFTVLFVVYGLQFSFGTFVDDIVATTGWSETRLQLIYAFYILVYSALSAVSGVFTDRYGPRRVIGVGAVLLAAGYLVWATAPNLWVAFLGLGVIAPLGMSASWVPCNATVVRWFIERRGTAVAWTTAGGSLANIVVPPISAALVAAYGWRSALAVLAVIGGLAMLTASTVIRRDPESAGQHPDGVIRTAAEVAAEPGMAVADAFRTTTYWLIFAMYSLSFVVVFVPFAHVNQFATDLGVSPLSAATVISSVGIGGFVGRLSAGPISDRVDRRLVAGVGFTVQLLGFIGLAAAQGLTLLYPSAVAFGFAYGAGVSVFPALVGDYFGRANAGAIVGRLFATAGSMAAVGPYVAQLLVDSSGSYRFAFLLAAAANGCALLIVTRLPAPTRS